MFVLIKVLFKNTQGNEVIFIPYMPEFAKPLSSSVVEISMVLTFWVVSLGVLI